MVPAYLMTVAVWGIWWEVRLLMPLYPILFALALSYLYEPRRGRGMMPRANGRRGS